MAIKKSPLLLGLHWFLSLPGSKAQTSARPQRRNHRAAPGFQKSWVFPRSFNRLFFLTSKITQGGEFFSGGCCWHNFFQTMLGFGGSPTHWQNKLDFQFFPNSFSYGVLANIGSGAGSGAGSGKVPGQVPGRFRGRFREGSGAGSGKVPEQVPGRFRSRFREGSGAGSGKVPGQVPGQVPGRFRGRFREGSRAGSGKVPGQVPGRFRGRFRTTGFGKVPGQVPNDRFREGSGSEGIWIAYLHSTNLHSHGWSMAQWTQVGDITATICRKTEQHQNYSITSSTAQGSDGSFKNRKLIGEIGCCESPMAEQKHWWIKVSNCVTD